MVDNAEPSANGVSGDSTVTLPVHQEGLRIGTKTVDTGRGVRVRKSVTERPYKIDEALLHDEVVVKHVPVDQIVSLAEAPDTRYEGNTLIVPILEEVLVVERRLRVKEEIHIIKKKREERHSETVFLKLEEVSIERFDEASEMQRK
jgi:uncharacterized protein (TIGR02271 family)